MRSAKRVSIHVVTDDPEARLPDLLASLDGQVSQDFQIIVVDNASGRRPGSMADTPHVAMLRNPRPQSFARTMNQAAALAVSRWEGQELGDRYIFVASPNLLFSPEAVEEAIKGFEGDAMLQLAVPKLLHATRAPSEDGQGDWEFGTRVASAGVKLTRGRRPQILGMGQEDAGQYDSPNPEPFAPTPAAFILRASALGPLGPEPFDERLAPAAAVIDIAWRLRRKGGRVARLPNVVAWFQPGSQTSLWLDSAERLRFETDLQRVERANDLLVNRLFHAPWILFERFVRALRRLLHPGSWRGWLIAMVGPALRPHGEDAVESADQARWFA